MSPPAEHPPTPEALLGDLAWVRGLALRLVADPGTADDVAQEAWLAGLERRRAVGDAPRSWLGGVVRNLARLSVRRRARRAEREERAARDEALPSAEAVAARIELQRLLATELSRLEEPFQTAVALRHVEGLAVERIAEITGAPAATVRTRVKRGLDRLRARLEDQAREEGGVPWRALALTLAPREALARAASGASAYGPAAAAGLVALAALAVLAAWGVRSWPDAGPARGPAEIAGGAPDPAPSGAPPLSRPSGGASAAAGASVERRSVAGDARASLVVTVRGAGDGALRPLAFARVEGHVLAVRVDADGVVALDVPAGEELPLVVGEARTGSESVALVVSALAPGEVRTLRIELGPAGGGRLVGRALDGASGRSIPGATLTLRDGSGWFEADERDDPAVGVAAARADERGLFVVVARDPARTTLVLSAAGYTPRVLGFESGHVDEASALDVALLPTARLEGLVTGRDGAPLAGVRVEAAAERAALWAEAPLRPPGLAGELAWHWEASTGADGRFALSDLPARAPFTVRLVRGERVRAPVLEPLVLEPAETRSVEWSFGARARIVGEARDAVGRPYSGGELWLRPRPERGHTAMLVMDQRPAPVDRVRTDPRGRFVFDEVLPGAYVLGPAPAPVDPAVPLFERPPATVDPDAVAPIGVPVDVEETSVDVFVTLDVHRALYLVGRVEDVDGSVPPALVEATVLDRDAARTVPVAADGTFVIGPTLPDAHTLRAMPFPGLPGRASSEPVTVAPAPPPGTAPIVLRLREARSVAGVVHGPAGDLAAATVLVAPVGAPHRALTGASAADGRFHIDMVVGDEVFVLARSGDHVAVAGPLVPGPDDLRLDLAPGAVVELASDVPGPVVVETAAGAPCGRARLEPGRVARLVVPVGRIRARRLVDGAPADAGVEGVARAGVVTRLAP